MEERTWTPLDGLAKWVAERPDAVFLTQPMNGRVKEYTWAEVDQQVRCAAAFLKEQLPPGSHIGLLSRNCAHWVMAQLAIWMAGHVSVPIFPTFNRESLQHVLTHSDAKMLLLGPMENWDQLAQGVPELLPIVTLPNAPEVANATLWQSLQTTQQPITAYRARAAEELGQIIYTSGSTGLAKGVMASFGAMSQAVASMQKLCNPGPSDRVLSYLPMAHVYEGIVIFGGALCYGMHIYFTEGLATFQADLRRASPTLFQSVPRLWVKFQQGVQESINPRLVAVLLKTPVLRKVIARKILTQLGLQDVRFASTGAAPLSPAIINWYRALGLELLELYGMTENYGYSHATRPGHVRVGYTGHPQEGVEQRLGAGDEIQLRTPGLFMGYYKEPEKTAECFTADGWFRTGDRGSIDATGNLRIVGRVKEIFKSSKGKYVAPAPIENALIHHPLIESVYVTGANLAQPLALIALSEIGRMHLPGSQRKLTADLTQHLANVNAGLESHERLACLVVVNDNWSIASGHLTPTLKIRRHVMDKQYDPQLEAWVAIGEPVVWAS
jgi:long-chain acyl-CoA synthetase